MSGPGECSWGVSSYNITCFIHLLCLHQWSSRLLWGCQINNIQDARWSGFQNKYYLDGILRKRQDEHLWNSTFCLCSFKIKNKCDIFNKNTIQHQQYVLYNNASDGTDAQNKPKNGFKCNVLFDNLSTSCTAFIIAWSLSFKNFGLDFPKK